jgi:hypothetical protein
MTPELKLPSLASLNPFAYKLQELLPLIVAAIFLAGYAVTMFVAVPIGFIPACAALAPAVVGVVLVFVTEATDALALEKALKALQASAVAVAVYFTTVPASTTNKIGVLIGALCQFVALIAAHRAAIKAGLPHHPAARPVPVLAAGQSIQTPASEIPNPTQSPPTS